MRQKSFWASTAVLAVIFALAGAAPSLARDWSKVDFSTRPLLAYPLPSGHNQIIGQLVTYTIKKGDTLLDVGRWYGVTAKEISDANDHMDWWLPAAGKTIILPTEHILPMGPHTGIVLNIPEMRLYYYPPPIDLHKSGRLKSASYSPARVVYTFPVGLGRFDWRTPIAKFWVRGKTVNPTWVVPKDIYLEHLERDGEAEHVVPGGTPDNPLGYYRLDLTLPMYAIHGTNVPWGVGMEVSHGCVRLFPEDIDRLFHKVKVGTPGYFVYEPVKFGWRGDALYVEVHPDLYGKYPGLWRHTLTLVKQMKLTNDVDYTKLETAVEQKTGIPTYVMPGPEPGAPADGANWARLNTTGPSVP
jgi:L,D-transpeptidase ErfK/SrfK